MLVFDVHLVISRAHGDTLEVAAGTGRNLEYYSNDVRLTLVDKSENMLKETRKKLLLESNRPQVILLLFQGSNIFIVILAEN
jgi:ubiquinone/menaquinone biosynthesis C-methylase UbiE